MYSNKISWNAELFIKKKVNFIVATVMKIWADSITGSTLLLFNMNFNLLHFTSKTTLTMSMDTKIKFSWTDNGK